MTDAQQNQQPQTSPLADQLRELAERLREAPDFEVRGLIADGFELIAEVV